MNYLKAVLRKDNDTKIEELQKLIVLGEKLKKDTTPDIKKLDILLKRESKAIEKSIKKDNSREELSTKSNTKYSIQSVYTKNNNIIIDFNVDMDKNDIKFFELKQSPLYKDVYDIKGYFKDAVPTKLSIDGVNKITLGQFKPNVLRVVLTDYKNLKTSYKLDKRQLTISINDIEIKQEISKPIIKSKKEVNNNPYIDTKNSIKSITAEDNKITIKFNKDYSRKDMKYLAYKYNNSYEDVFDIKGKFKYVVPTRLSIKNIDRIIVSQKDSNTIRIKIRDKKDAKVNYILRKRELVIKISTDNEIKNKKSSLPYPNFRSRIIVIDAGHGAHDAGAVGPNKRYEKVVTLKVAKYLYNILKQRGHKVYLTRNKDQFIKVNRRTILANEKNADIFISIHANSVPKSKAHEIEGIETFFLSPARSERAKRVAAKENSADISSMSASSKSAFLESLNRPRITASHKLSIDVQSGILQSVKTSYKDVKDSGVREGPFWVLVGAQMPSILIELGYISHPKESKRLYNSNYQQLLANGIANGVDSYFSKNP
jgi:N-acetylmuramoyl-L-alanine amidase